jgi:hypothetical protein
VARERRDTGGGDDSSLSPLLFLDGRSSWHVKSDHLVLVDAWAVDDARCGERVVMSLDAGDLDSVLSAA